MFPAHYQILSVYGQLLSRALQAPCPWGSRRREPSIFHAVEGVSAGEGLHESRRSKRAQLQLQQEGLAVGQAGGAIILIDRIVAHREVCAFVLIARSSTPGSDCEGPRTGEAYQSGRVKVAAHVKDDVSLCKIVIVEFVARGKC